MVLSFYSAPLISKEHCSAPLADNSAPWLEGALLKWANSALQKSNMHWQARILPCFPKFKSPKVVAAGPNQTTFGRFHGANI